MSAKPVGPVEWRDPTQETLLALDRAAKTTPGLGACSSVVWVVDGDLSSPAYSEAQARRARKREEQAREWIKAIGQAVPPGALEHAAKQLGHPYEWPDLADELGQTYALPAPIAGEGLRGMKSTARYIEKMRRHLKRGKR
jgi:hypothetical protein